MSTRILNSSKYVDLICSGKKVMLCTMWLPRKDIAPLVSFVEKIPIGMQKSFSSTLGRGLLGTCIGGIAGTIIGVASAKGHMSYRYIIHLLPGFELSEISVETTDKNLINWLETHC